MAQKSKAYRAAAEKIEAEGVPYRFAYSLTDLGLA